MPSRRAASICSVSPAQNRQLDRRGSNRRRSSICASAFGRDRLQQPRQDRTRPRSSAGRRRRRRRSSRGDQLPAQLVEQAHRAPSAGPRSSPPGREADRSCLPAGQAASRNSSRSAGARLGRAPAADSTAPWPGCPVDVAAVIRERLAGHGYDVEVQLHLAARRPFKRAAQPAASARDRRSSRPAGRSRDR